MARFRAVPDWVWHEAERQRLRLWQRDHALDQARKRAEALWLPRARASLAELRMPRVIELYPGPVSIAARLIGERRITLIEPLADDFRRMFPGEMPEEARILRQPIEKSSLAEAHYDAAIAIEAIDRAQNPEIALAELYRALKPGGVLLVGSCTYPRWRVIAQLLGLRIAPRLAVRRRLYAFTMPALRRTIARRFWITNAECVACPKPEWWQPALWWFVAEKPSEEAEDV